MENLTPKLIHQCESILNYLLKALLNHSCDGYEGEREVILCKFCTMIKLIFFINFQLGKTKILDNKHC